MTPYKVVAPNGERVAVILSVPHCGTQFPADIRDEYKSDLISRPDDTDWFVDNLYDFATEMGIAMISSVYHRWVIDLNRAPDDKPLYNDGRVLTGLCPFTDFLGNPIYADERLEVAADEVTRRLALYHQPYHAKLKELISEMKEDFGKVLLWECHSIRQYVPTIYPEKFPDLVLGDSDGASASPGIVKLAYDSLSASKYSVSHNFPFKGGFITREYGRPLHNEHAVQLEMSKINYMDDKEISYDHDRANAMRELLKTTLSGIIDPLFQSASRQ
ncbi:MAG: N-formylglutamate amidohydrolase [Chryseolinea sp.]